MATDVRRVKTAIDRLVAIYQKKHALAKKLGTIQDVAYWNGRIQGLDDVEQMLDDERVVRHVELLPLNGLCKCPTRRR
jgi:hypothetical protein